MPRTKPNFDKFLGANFNGANLAGFARIAIVVTLCLSLSSMAQQPGQKTFASAEDASTALVAAAQNNDEKAMLDILGPDARTSSHRETRPRTPKTAPTLRRSISKCIAW